jgi:hypothetical protein
MTGSFSTQEETVRGDGEGKSSHTLQKRPANAESRRLSRQAKAKEDSRLEISLLLLGVEVELELQRVLLDANEHVDIVSTVSGSRSGAERCLRACFLS